MTEVRCEEELYGMSEQFKLSDDCEREKERTELLRRIAELEDELREWRCDTVAGRCRGCPDCQPIGGIRESTRARNRIAELETENALLQGLLAPIRAWLKGFVKQSETGEFMREWECEYLDKSRPGNFAREWQCVLDESKSDADKREGGALRKLESDLIKITLGQR